MSVGARFRVSWGWLVIIPWLFAGSSLGCWTTIICAWEEGAQSVNISLVLSACCMWHTSFKSRPAWFVTNSSFGKDLRFCRVELHGKRIPCGCTACLKRLPHGTMIESSENHGKCVIKWLDDHLPIIRIVHHLRLWGTSECRSWRQWISGAKGSEHENVARGASQRHSHSAVWPFSESFTCSLGTVT